MNVGELIDELQKFDRSLNVRYDYDTGNGYPTFVRAYLATAYVSQREETFVCLDEFPPRDPK